MFFFKCTLILWLSYESKVFKIPSVFYLLQLDREFQKCCKCTPSSSSRVSFYVSWLLSRCHFLTSTFIKNVSVSVVRCLHQCRHFGVKQHEMSWTTFMPSWSSLLDLHQRTVPHTLGYIYIMKEPLLLRKRITILNALLAVCVLVIQYFSFVTSILKQVYLMQSTGYIPEINPSLRLKQAKYLWRQLKM